MLQFKVFYLYSKVILLRSHSYKSMCTISIDVDEKALRQANPNLDNIVAIRQYYHRKKCYHRYRRKSVSIIMKNDTNIKIYSPILQEAHDSITP